jgi:hypothetical protein
MERFDGELERARWSLLQTIVEDFKCVRPDKYQSDCGECAICRCRYRKGALVGYEHNSRVNIPGTPEKRKAHDEFWDDILLVLAERSRRPGGLLNAQKLKEVL